MTYKQNLNKVWKEISSYSLNYSSIIKHNHPRNFKIRDNKKYRGIGRPRNKDYIYFTNFNQFEEVQNKLIIATIGQPIDPKIPQPDIFKILFRR